MNKDSTFCYNNTLINCKGWRHKITNGSGCRKRVATVKRNSVEKYVHFMTFKLRFWLTFNFLISVNKKVGKRFFIINLIILCIIAYFKFNQECLLEVRDFLRSWIILNKNIDALIKWLSYIEEYELT